MSAIDKWADAVFWNLINYNNNKYPSSGVIAKQIKQSHTR